MLIIDVHNHAGRSADGGAVTPDKLDAAMRKAGIARYVVCPTDETGHNPCYTEQNDWIAALAAQNPRVIGFGRVAPAHCPGAVDEVHRIAERGLRGLKLHVFSDKFKIQEAHAAACAAAALGLPVLCHSHHTSFTSNARHWRALFDASGATFIIAHGGKDGYKELGRIVPRHPNVFVDTTCVSFNRTRHLFETLGPARLMFASDMPYSHPEIELVKWRLLASDRDLEPVFHGNACRLFGIDPATAARDIP